MYAIKLQLNKNKRRERKGVIINKHFVLIEMFSKKYENFIHNIESFETLKHIHRLEIGNTITYIRNRIKKKRKTKKENQKLIKDYTYKFIFD